MTAPSPAVPDPPAPVIAAPAASKGPRQLNAWHIVISSFAGIAVVLLAGLIAYPFTHPNGSTQWSDLIRSVVLAVAAMGAVPAAFVAFRRQQFTERDHELDRGKLALEQAKEDRRRDELSDATTRADRKDLRDRYTAAAGQIGSDKAPVRLAGVYAMAQLADEWGAVDWSQEQTCIDVLCAYLRMPWPAPSDERRVISDPQTKEQKRIRNEDARVRETILRVIGAHLRPRERASDPPRWHHKDFDVTGAELPDVDFTTCVLRRLTANGATFTGEAAFDGATFRGRASFTGATFKSAATFRGTEFRRAGKFDGARVEDIGLFSDATFNADATFDNAVFESEAAFARTKFKEPTTFLRTRVRGATVQLDGEFLDPRADGDNETVELRPLGPELGYIAGERVIRRPPHFS